METKTRIVIGTFPMPDGSLATFKGNSPREVTEAWVLAKAEAKGHA